VGAAPLLVLVAVPVRGSCLDCLTRHADREVMVPDYQIFARNLITMARQLDRRADAVGVLERLSAAYPRDRDLPRLLAEARAPAVPSGP
jgi:hypothetical protein